MTATPVRDDGGAAPWGTAEFTERLRAVAEDRYHDRHPFNVRMRQGELTPAELRRWIINRFHYQRHIPVKDALILAKFDDPALRRAWVRRIQDHDGTAAGQGGIERWLRLGEAAGLERPALWDTARVLPGVRLAVEGYVNFCRLRPALDAVAASLTELSAPGLMRTRIAAFERYYPWIEAEGLAYFRTRIGQGGRDSEEALALVQGWARTREQQERAVAALTFKCEVLWALLDAVDSASDSLPTGTADGVSGDALSVVSGGAPGDASRLVSERVLGDALSLVSEGVPRDASLLVSEHASGDVSAFVSERASGDASPPASERAPEDTSPLISESASGDIPPGAVSPGPSDSVASPRVRGPAQRRPRAARDVAGGDVASGASGAAAQAGTSGAAAQAGTLGVSMPAKVPARHPGAPVQTDTPVVPGPAGSPP
ncbi:pyrroloquinoline-quinone synthase [Streptomyces olivochromogenes]|uniref:Pyrroloquinoline-quinone synthase n=1 Tax=Streptomyces olivochromogenes TaxID=1963 RepID=A0A250V3B4_STROL|nr:pyrroloquinoline-quinone synthase [Streptomyces olivochromogenes]